MFGLLTRSRRPAPPVAHRPIRPSLEVLETRDCPSTLTLNVAYGVGKAITLYGQVTAGAAGSSTPGFGGGSQPLGGGSQPGVPGATVAFSRSATGSATTDANGNFVFTTQAASLGEVDAATTDGQSNTASVVLSAAPNISNFKATEEGPTNYWDITGSVTDGKFSVAALTAVQIHGSPVTIYNGGQGLTASVDGSENFCLVVKLNGTINDNGNIDAQFTDAWGQKSNDPTYTINQ
jgi:hypothetical protein